MSPRTDKRHLTDDETTLDARENPWHAVLVTARHLKTIFKDFACMDTLHRSGRQYSSKQINNICKTCPKEVIVDFRTNEWAIIHGGDAFENRKERIEMHPDHEALRRLVDLMGREEEKSCERGWVVVKKPVTDTDEGWVMVRKRS